MTGAHAPTRRSRRYRLAVFLHHALDELAVAGVARKSECKREPRSAAEAAHEQLAAAAVRVTFDVLETEAQVPFSRTRSPIAPIPPSQSTSAVMRRQLVVPFEPGDPLPHVHEAHRAGPGPQAKSGAGAQGSNSLPRSYTTTARARSFEQPPRQRHLRRGDGAVTASSFIS